MSTLSCLEPGITRGRRCRDKELRVMAGIDLTPLLVHDHRLAQPSSVLHSFAFLWSYLPITAPQLRLKTDARISSSKLQKNSYQRIFRDQVLRSNRNAPPVHSRSLTSLSTLQWSCWDRTTFDGIMAAAGNNADLQMLQWLHRPLYTVDSAMSTSHLEELQLYNSGQSEQRSESESTQTGTFFTVYNDSALRWIT